jgi:hypothetical protein
MVRASKVSTKYVILSYVLSVTLATLIFVAWVVMPYSPSITAWPRASDFASLVGLVFIVCWVTAVAGSVAPCLVLHLIAHSLRIRNLLFYISSGIGVALCVLPIWGHVRLLNEGDTYDSKTLAVLGVAVAGGSAGLAFWRLAGRHF